MAAPIILLDDGSVPAEALGHVFPHARRLGAGTPVPADAAALLVPIGHVAPSTQAATIFYGDGVGEDLARAAFERGADAVLDPGVQGRDELRRMLAHAVLRRASTPAAPPARPTEPEVIPLAAQDPLTGLLNDRAFVSRLREEVVRARRHERTLCVAVIEPDNLHAVAERHGREWADDLLVGLGQRLHRAARTGDPVARVGPNVFAWLMLDTDLEGGEIAARRASQATRTVPFSQVGAQTVSMGLACLTDATDDVELYRLAADALATAQRAGRDRVVSHRPVSLAS